MQHRSTRSQTMFCSKYSTLIESMSPLTDHGNGVNWCTCTEDGDKSYLHRHAFSISNFSARTEPLSERIWVAGQPFLSSSTMITLGALLLATKMVCLLHLSTRIVCAVSFLL